MVIVEVQDLVKKYPSFELKNVSFSLENRSVFCCKDVVKDF